MTKVVVPPNIVCNSSNPASVTSESSGAASLDQGFWARCEADNEDDSSSCAGPRPELRLWVGQGQGRRQPANGFAAAGPSIPQTSACRKGLVQQDSAAAFWPSSEPRCRQAGPAVQNRTHILLMQTCFNRFDLSGGEFIRRPNDGFIRRPNDGFIRRPNDGFIRRPNDGFIRQRYGQFIRRLNGEIDRRLAG
jgi:hypothetical protein